jgi:hypothetical protein
VKEVCREIICKNMCTSLKYSFPVLFSRALSLMKVRENVDSENSGFMRRTTAGVLHYRKSAPRS